MLGTAMSASVIAPKAEVDSEHWRLRDGSWRVEGAARDVIQDPKPESRIMRYELSNYEWIAIKPMLPNKPRGNRRVNDRRVLNGIFWALRSGAPWATCHHAMAAWFKYHSQPAALWRRQFTISWALAPSKLCVYVS
jgi:hypothetical protein